MTGSVTNANVLFAGLQSTTTMTLISDLTMLVVAIAIGGTENGED